MTIANRSITLAEPIFHSICGEGTEIGLPAVFIRTYGCNRRCKYCDSRYSWESSGTKTSIDSILTQLEAIYQRTNCRRVFLTGGEPTLQENLQLLMSALSNQMFGIMLQTNGSQFLPEIFDLANRLLSVDVKGPSSGQLADLSIISQIYSRYVLPCPSLIPNVQFKFVVADVEDFKFAKEVISRFRMGTFVMQPEYAQGSLKMITEWLLADTDLGGMKVRVLPQLHKIMGVK